jgi:hypothetical protein
MKHFWNNEFIPKELQDLIQKTLRQARVEKIPGSPAEYVKEFLVESENILSGSASEKEKTNQNIKK